VRTVILVPRRAGIPERDEIWAWCEARWMAEHPDLPIYEGHHDDGPFNRSAAINLASRRADADGRWDLAVIIDADVFLDPRQVLDAIEVAGRTGRVTWAFQWWAGMDQRTARSLLAGDADPAQLLQSIDVAFAAAGPANELGYVPAPTLPVAGFEKVNPVSWSCCFVVPRQVFDALGGFDERFAGWGWEDMAFQSAVVGLHGYERVPGAIVHVWHPRHPGLGQDGVNKRRNRQLGRRYMYALRAKGYHDRAMPADADEMARDRANLLRLMELEESDRAGRPAPDLPNWRDWLPSLEELVGSWKEGRPAGPAPAIAVVVRTGGPIERWGVRSGYLREMLASLDAHVSASRVVARVIFADWPEAVHAELGAIAREHGFYVVGEGNVGFTASMQRLWKYLAGRSWHFDQVFLVEDDFRFERDVDLDELGRTLEAHPHLVQVALLRDACYEAERERGGILGHPVDEFDFRGSGDHAWLEHRRFFTLNPGLIRRSLLGEPWPTQQHSEAVFGRRLFKDPDKRSALWGHGEAWVTHLGVVRAGGGY
jgi:hypothetical protein